MSCVVLTCQPEDTCVCVSVCVPSAAHFIIGSIAHSATHRFLTYSEADFEVIRPARATCCTNGGEIWHGGGDQRSLLRAKFHPHRCKNKSIVTPKLKFDQNVEYKRPARAYTLRDFHKICRVCTPFQDA